MPSGSNQASYGRRHTLTLCWSVLPLRGPLAKLTGRKSLRPPVYELDTSLMGITLPTLDRKKTGGFGVCQWQMLWN